MRKIESVNVSKNTVYINFSGGRFATRTWQNGKWVSSGSISKEELAEARRLACVDGKWQAYRAPKPAAATVAHSPRWRAEDDFDPPTLTAVESARLNRRQTSEPERYG